MDLVSIQDPAIQSLNNLLPSQLCKLCKGGGGGGGVLLSKWVTSDNQSVRFVALSRWAQIVNLAFTFS